MNKRSKKLASVLTAAALAAALVVPAAAAPVTVTVNGAGSGAAAYVNDDWRTMVSTDIAPELGLTCQVEGDQVRFTKNGATVIFTLGSDQVGGMTMDTAAVEQDGVVYVPLAYLAEAFGLDVTWDGATGTTGTSSQQTGPINVSGVPAPSYDYTQANQLPMTGYFEKTLQYTDAAGAAQERTVKFYISENACIRPYFTLIAVPDGVDTTQFLEECGWFDLADAQDECLLILEPENGTWGELDREYEYVQNAINFYKSPASDTAALDTGKTAPYFSSYGMNYFVGYGAGAPAVELWAANNPVFTISQVYIDSTGVDSERLAQAAAQYYDGDEAGTNAPLNVPEDQWIYYDELPIPTWFINCTGEDSIRYWKQASDCVQTAQADGVLGQVYAQSEDSDAWQTEYYGPISKVAVLEDESFDAVAATQEIYDFLTTYTRYDNTCAFASQLAYREHVKDAMAKGTLTVDYVTAGGVLSEYMVYVPENAQEKYPDGSPVVFIWAGSSQSDLVFMEATSWRTLADQEGFICVYPSEQYAANSVTVGHKNTRDFYLQVREALRNSDLNIDWSRVYCTGQSGGSLATNVFASSTPEYFAAYASTSGPTLANSDTSGNSGIDMVEELPYEVVPNYLLVGLGDVPARTGSLFDDDDNQLDMWAEYFLAANQVGGLQDYTSHEVTGAHDRFDTYTWTSDQGVPLTKVTMTAFRNHNCIVQEMPLMWEYLSCFSYDLDEETGEVTRYYSPSAFVEDDAVVLE